MRLPLLSLGLGLMLILSACNPLTSFGSKPVIDYKQNPNPKQRYDITMTIADAPGQFASMEGSAQYEVINHECLPPPDSNLAGHSSRMTRHVPFTLTPVSAGEYTGTIYADKLLDEDYHGRGVCQWQLTHVGVKLMATGAEGETKFLPGISADPLLAEQTKTLYFWKGYYPRAGMENFPEFGDSNLVNVPADKQDEFFIITLTPKEAQP